MHKPRRKKTHLSGPAAVSEVAGAIRGLTDTLMSDNLSTQPPPPNTPMRRTSAVKMAVADDSLTNEEKACLLKLFSDNISMADTYVACSDKEVRTLLVHQALGLPLHS